MFVYLSKKNEVRVETFADASKAVMAHWAGKGSTAFYRDPKAGIIENNDGLPIAHVSYNGRVWEGVQRFTLGNKEIL